MAELSSTVNPNSSAMFFMYIDPHSQICKHILMEIDELNLSLPAMGV